MAEGEDFALRMFLTDSCHSPMTMCTYWRQMAACGHVNGQPGRVQRQHPRRYLPRVFHSQAPGVAVATKLHL